MKLVLIFLTAKVALIRAESSCADGWIEMGKDSCLMFGPQIKLASWFHVQTECDSIAGGYLPELITPEQRDLFKDFMLNYDDLIGTTTVFLGGSDLAHEQNWMWIAHNTAIEDINWAPESPDDSPQNTKDCLAGMSNSSLWKDISCEQEFERVAFVCMTSKVSTTITTTTTTTTTTTIITTTANPCESGWSYFESACYIHERDQKTWEEASTFCRQLYPGAHLTAVTNGRENEFLGTLPGSPWIGGHRPSASASGAWRWTDGSPWSFTNWGSGFPDDHPNNHCVTMYYTGQLRNGPCSQRRTSLCKYSL